MESLLLPPAARRGNLPVLLFWPSQLCSRSRPPPDEVHRASRLQNPGLRRDRYAMHRRRPRRRAPSFVNDVVPDLHPLRLQPGRLSRQGGRPERLPPVAARLRPRDGLPVADPRVQRPPHLHRRSRGEPAAAQATGLAAHEGGKVFGIGSRPIRCCSTGFAPGMPGPPRTSRSSQSWRSLPGDARRKPGDEAAADRPGRVQRRRHARRDLADRFDSNDPGMADVDAAGKVRVLRHGETAIRATFQARSPSSS